MVIWLPSAALVGSEQYLVATPSTWTVQAALGHAAAVFGAGQAQRVAPQQGRVGIDNDLMCMSVDSGCASPLISEGVAWTPAVADVTMMTKVDLWGLGRP